MKVDLNKSFRELNPIISENYLIKRLYESNDYNDPDKIMWAIFLLDYPDKSLNPKAEIPFNDRLADIIGSYYNLNINDDFIKELRVYFENYCLSFEEKMFAIQKKILDSITHRLSSLNIELEKERNEILEISGKLPSFWKNFEKAKAEVLAVQNKTIVTEGGKELSRSERKRAK